MEITHEFHFAISKDLVTKALLDGQHVQKWWTNQASIENGKGAFHWKGHGWTVEVILEEPVDSNRIIWNCVKSNMQNTDAWVGSKIIFEILPEASGTRMKFTHSGYKNSPCYEVCNAGWKFVLGSSLKTYLETGIGMPYSADQ